MSNPAPRPAGPKMYFKDRPKAWFVRVRGVEIRLGEDEEAAQRRYREVMENPAAFAAAVLWAPPPPAPSPAPKAAPKPRTPRPPAATPPPEATRETTGKDFKTTLVNHRIVCKAFGITTDVLLRAVRKGEFPAPHSQIGTFHLFDRAAVEHKLETGLWPASTKFHGVRNVGTTVEDD